MLKIPHYRDFAVLINRCTLNRSSIDVNFTAKVRRKLLCIFLFALILFAKFSWAQSVHHQFRQLDANDGLSHNQVNCFLKDRKGFLWIGTYSGLNRFDGYSVQKFLNNPEDSTSISNNAISDLFETPDGNMGIVTSSGLCLYNPTTEKFSTNLSPLFSRYALPLGELRCIKKGLRKDYWFLLDSSGLVNYDGGRKKTIHLQWEKNNNKSIATNTVTSLTDTKDGTWLIHANGILEKVNFTAGQFEVTYRDTFLYNLNKGKKFSYEIMSDRDDDLWIFVRNDPQGVYYLDVSKKKFKHFHQGSIPALNSNIVSSMAQADNGVVWIGTDHGGINALDKKSFTVNYILNRAEDDKSLVQNSINTIYRDDDGILWIGTFKRGMSYYHENLIRFSLYRHFPLSTTGLPYSDVNRFVEDDKGNLWIGTDGGGLIYFDRNQNTFRQYLHDPRDPNSLSSNVIVSLCFDHEKHLWIGTYYGGLNMFDGKKFIHFNHDPANPESISDENIWEIFEDSKNRLWIGTMRGGLDRMDRRTNTFTHYRPTDDNSVNSNYIAAIEEDKQGNLWIGTNNGISMLEKETNRFLYYTSDRNKPGSLSDNFVFDILADESGRVWVATGNGLNIFNDRTKTFQELKDKDGLPHNTILSILEDNEGAIWVSTFNGISHITTTDPGASTSFQLHNYDEGDGLQGKQFNENAAWKTSRGEIIFGGANGFNIFFPNKLEVNKKVPPVVLTDLQIYDKSILPGDKVNGNILLDKSITEASSIVIPHDQHVLSIEFSALNYFNPEKNQYKYTLEGAHTEWLKADSKTRKVTFTDLSPGEYTFRVKASNNDGYWNQEGTQLSITILPPFWKTKTAILIYFVLLVIVLLLTRKLIQKLERVKFEREKERQQATRIHELDLMKIKFFTNVSHEFRTPLTLILTPLNRMLKAAQDPGQQKQFLLIQRNAKRLLNLVNQLLDFRKLETQELKFNPSEGDIIKFIEETVYSFSDLSDKKDIKLSFTSSVPSCETMFDQDKLEKILFNLLSNAFKFTPEHGQVSVNAIIKTGEFQEIIITVTDTGIGIPAEKLDLIFERFFQNELPKSLVNQGSGIGLSITREFAKIHGGNISVSSLPGEGTCFTVTLPITEFSTYVAINPESLEQVQLEDVGEEREGVKKPLLLLIEDNEDFRFYLKDNLKSEYNIAEARNGEEGWKAVMAKLPDLVVSDVMMPELNGLELCKRIKTDSRVSHTPVILLTAKSAEEQKLEGFESGADDYITKPFNFEILVSRIRHLIAEREKFYKTFPTHLDVKATELKITSLDEKFIQKAIQCVEDNISNTDFSVEMLSRELGISRAHFYKKVISLTGKSPLEFIRMIRLQQAAQLLKKSQMTVAEIAYQVGFNNPKYFARSFKEVYKVLPSIYASQNSD